MVSRTMNVKSIRHNINNATAEYGLRHFLYRYGIEAVINDSSNPGIGISYKVPPKYQDGVTIQILPGEIRSEIIGYLEIDGNRTPLLETPETLDAGDSRVLATFQAGDTAYPCVTINGGNLVIGFDIFSEIGYWLAGYVEPALDKQPIDIEALIRIPVVDILEEFLLNSLQFVFREKGSKLVAKPAWPEAKQFVLCLTHDVDRVYKTFQYLPSAIKHLRAGNLSGLARQAKSFLSEHGKTNPYWNFNRIMELENELEVKSTFFFLDESGNVSLFNPKSWILFAGRYNIDNPEIMEMIKELQRNGFELGTHGSYHSYKDAELLKREKRKLGGILNEDVSGIRQHYLNFDSKATFKIQESAGFKYDSTLGFSQYIGFRRGTCYPFYPLLDNGQQASLLEIPLVIMDSALAGRNPFEDCVEIMQTVKRYGGVLTLLWHQRSFNDEEFPGMADLYRRLIEEAGAQGAWITNARGVWQWLTQSSRVGSSRIDTK